MPFEEGHEKIGGRQKGSVNKRTAQVYALIGDILDKCAETVIDDIAMLPPDKRLDLICKLSEFVLPKLARTTIDGGGEEGAIVINFVKKDANNLPI